MSKEVFQYFLTDFTIEPLREEFSLTSFCVFLNKKIGESSEIKVPIINAINVLNEKTKPKVLYKTVLMIKTKQAIKLAITPGTR